MQSIPMPGEVVSVNFKEGDTITKGQTLVVMSAMKMETNIPEPSRKSPYPWGQALQKDDLIIEIRPIN